MLDEVRLYLRLLGISVRGQMEYRASFIMLSLGQFLIIGTEFLGIMVLFDRFGSLEGWQLPEVALLYGMVNLTFALADAFTAGFDQFGDLIKSGDFDRMLLRPRSAALQVAGQELTVRRAGRLLQGLVVLGWAAWSLGLRWTPAKVMLLLAAIPGGACLFFGLFVLQATLAFWTVETLEIMNTVTYGGVETAQYPLAIYRDGFRRFFTFVIPLACVNYFPALALMEHRRLEQLPSWLPWVSPAVGVLFLWLCLQVWQVGVRHYRSTGS